MDELAVKVDELLRRLDGDESLRRAKHLWRKAHALIQSVTAPPTAKDIYVDVLRWSARTIMHRLELTGSFEESWSSYRDLFTDALNALGKTREESVLKGCENIYLRVLEYPTTPRDLFFEYLHSLAAQRHKYEEMTAGVGQRTAPPKPIIGQNIEEAAVVPSIPLEEAKRYLSLLPDRLTFSLKSGITRLRLGNPMRIPDADNIWEGYACDTCGVGRLFVGYEAVLYDDKGRSVRNTAKFWQLNGIFGYDLCIACALYFYRKAVHRIAYALRHPSLHVEVDATSSVKVCSVRMAESAVHMTVCISPWGAQPIAWVVEAGVDEPPPTWRSRLTWTSENISELAQTEGRTAEDMCVVCLESLVNDTPVVKTTCAHWFHVECIQEKIRMTSDECPICRHKNIMPDGASLTREHNVYCLTLAAPADAQEFLVAVGALLTANEVYENPTNLAACTSVRVCR